MTYLMFWGGVMARKIIDCREYPSEINCTVAIAADSADELLELAATHAVQTHGEPDTPELRAAIRQMIREGVLT